MSLNRSLMLLFALAVPCAVVAQTAEGFTPPGPNVALGKSYTLEPDPNYALCTDEGDLVQLTDGEFAPEEDAIWFHKECVGWYYPRPAAFVTIDLEQDTPIAGVAVSTQAGAAGVNWPAAILIAVSGDGEEFGIVGDLMHLSSKHGARPTGGRYVFATDDLRCHGRYVRVILPQARYVFTDEIEVYRGPDELLGRPFDSEPLTDITEYFATNQVPMAIRNWVAADVYRARRELTASDAPQAVRTRVAQMLDRVAANNARLLAPTGDTYRAIFPLTDGHRRVFRALGALRRAEGRPGLELWKTNRWQRVSLWDEPPPDHPVALQARMMQGEHRSDTVNVANNTPHVVSARVWLEGLPGGTTPSYVSLRAAEYVAMGSGFWDADALPEAVVADDAWQVRIPAGVTRHLWLAFKPGADVPPGTYEGTVNVEDGRGLRLQAPLRLTVEPLQYPDEHTLAFGMWDYAYGRGSYGVKEEGIQAAVAHMQSYGYNVPWSHLFPWATEENFDAEDRLIEPPDMTAFDEWVAMWPDARYYAVFFGGWTVRAERFAGTEIGSDRFTRRFSALMRFWADHMLGLGIEPERLLILTVDEPSTGSSGSERSEMWARTIKAAVPEFTLYVDPTDHEPQEVGLRGMYEAHDILCPHISYYFGDSQAARDFYQELRAGGRELWFYNTAGGPAMLDAIRNHRGQQWKLWPEQGTGTHFWSYGDVGGSPGGSWNHLAATGEVYAKAYIDAASVTDGKHWLAIIEGIQDYEYLRMLRDRIAELEAAGVQSPALDRARELLETLPQEAIEAADGGDIDAYDSARLQVLDALMELR